MRTPIRLSISFALITFVALLYFFTVLNGYILNIVSGLRANSWVVTLALVAEFAATIFSARKRIAVEFDWFEFIGFLATVVGVWIYFIAASLPTLLPPTQSEDAVRLYLMVSYSFNDGSLVTWYPAGSPFFVAMIAHWLGLAPLRAVHPTTAFFVAMNAGAAYGIACSLLRPPLSYGGGSRVVVKFENQEKLNQSRFATTREGWGSVLALATSALLFVPWSYFAGIINWEQYYMAQAFAQFFILVTLIYTMHYASEPRGIFVAMVGVALFGVLTTHPVFIALPLGLFGLAVLAQTVRDARRARGAWIGLIVFVAMIAFVTFGLDRLGVLSLRIANLAFTSNVGERGVANPGIETLGGPIFLLLAVIGAILAWRADARGKILVATLALWAAQYVALVFLQPLLKISGYRVDKTFYILAYLFAILAALALGRALTRFEPPRRWLAPTMVASVIALIALVAWLRPPIYFSPLTESELDAANWAKDTGRLDTYQINSLDPLIVRAYWLSIGIWRETVPNEYYQWIPAGTKLGPTSFEEWLGDPAWGNYLLVRDAASLGSAPVRVVYQSGQTVIAQKNSGAIVAPTPQRSARWHFGSTLNLIGYDLGREKFAAGETLELTTYTESIYPPPATVHWRMTLVNREGRVISQMERDPFDNKFPLQRWSSGKPARDEWALAIPASTPPGIYMLNLGLFFGDIGDYMNAFPTTGENFGKPLPMASLAKIKIPLPEPNAEELRGTKSLNVRVGENYALVNYVLNVDRATRRVHLTLYWQGISKSPNDYTVFVHLLDASGKLIAQIDREPLDGNYPTSVWDAGEIIKDEYDLEIPAGAVTPLKIVVGMYAQPSLKRLPVGESDHIIFDLGF